MTLKSLNQVGNKRAFLRGLDTPILILRGQCDNQKWGYTKEYLNIFRDAKLEIMEGVGHHIIHPKKEEYLNLIVEFLED